MSEMAYIATNYLFCLVYYIIIVILFWFFGALMGLRFFTQTNFVTLALFLFGWGNALISLSFFFGAFLNTKRASVIIGYIVALMGSLISVIVCVTIYDINSTMPALLNIW